MKRRTILCAALWALTAAAMGADGEQSMNVHASLSVDARHDKVLVTFKIENRGERRVGLPREIAADAALSRRLFDLREHPGEAEVQYTGRMVKRGPLTLDDYIELAPHSAHTHTIDITHASMRSSRGSIPSDGHLHAAAGRQRVQSHAGQQGCKNQSLHRFLRGQNSPVRPEDRMNIAK
jgi:hypothetical protein